MKTSLILLGIFAVSACKSSSSDQDIGAASALQNATIGIRAEKVGDLNFDAWADAFDGAFTAAVVNVLNNTKRFASATDADVTYRSWRFAPEFSGIGQCVYYFSLKSGETGWFYGRHLTYPGAGGLTLHSVTVNTETHLGMKWKTFVLKDNGRPVVELIANQYPEKDILKALPPDED